MIYAVGVVELKSIAKGVEACDAALKSAGIRLVSAHAKELGLLTGYSIIAAPHEELWKQL